MKDKTYAVIEEAKTRKQNLYRVGDTVENATVKMVLREKVVLNVDVKPPQSVDDALRFYESLRSTENLSLPLKRRGRSRTIDYSIK